MNRSPGEKTSSTLDRPFKEGDSALLRSERGDSYLVRIGQGTIVLDGRAVVDLSGTVGAREGSGIDVGGRRHVLLRPSLADLASQLRRRAQIITPKDALALLYLADVGPGRRVAEAGSGSGGLTLFLAHAIGPEGRVLSFDIREDHQRIAKENIERAGLMERVLFRTGDVRKGVGEMDLDAWLLDLPDPWEAVGPLLPSLRVGGHLAAYVPTYNQLERTIREMRSRGLVDVRAEEVLERGLHVGEGGTRPETEMLGHTGFLAAGRKVA